MSNTTAEKKKLQGVCALWKRTSKDGKKTYFTGQTEDKKTFLTAFYNTDKKNLKEPDLRIFTRDKDGNLSKEPFLSLWCNATKRGKKILSGNFDGKRVIGFIKSDASEKQPYISVYFEEDKLPVASEEPKQEAKSEVTRKAKQKKEPEFEEIKTDDDLPF